MHTFTTYRRVEFADTDMGGMVHFTRFFVFMESAEHEMLRSIGTEVHTEWLGQEIGWPRLEASCKYLSPARFGDQLTLRLEVERKGTSAMTYRFLITCDERIITRGRIASVCCLMDPESGPRPTPIPPAIADRLEEAPAGRPDSEHP